MSNKNKQPNKDSLIPLSVRRKLAKSALIGTGLAASVGGAVAFSEFQGGPPTSANQPALEQPDAGYHPYVVQRGDTLSHIVQLEFPGLELYGSEYNDKLSHLVSQLKPENQAMNGGNIHAGQILDLDPTADMENVDQALAQDN